MKTRINVAIRMRPLMEHETEQGDASSAIQLDDQSSIVR